jgi:ADP-heptose:LPS heptosyltransferase
VSAPRFGRILVVKLGDLGDFILTTPALRALREAQPGARIELLAPASASAVLSGNDLVDVHLRLPRQGLEGAPRQGLRGAAFAAAFAGALRRRRYDAVVLLQHLTAGPGVAKYAALIEAIGAPRRFGLDNGHGWFLTDRVRDEGFSAHHEATYRLKLVELLGADPRPRVPELPVHEADRLAADVLITGLTRPIVALHPGSGPYARARRWPVERFADVGRALRREFGAGIVVVGNERELNAPLAAATGGRDLTGRTSVRQLAGLLSSVDLLVTNDSGVMHIGAAAGARMVAVFGQTDPRAWGPYYGLAQGEGRAEVVELPLPCRPCLYRGHHLGWREGCSTRECIELLSVSRVLASAKRQIARAGWAQEASGSPPPTHPG